MPRRFIWIAALAALMTNPISLAGVDEPAPRPNGPFQRAHRCHALTGADVLIRPGERVNNATIIIRDGIIEAIREEDGELLGEERLIKLLKQESATEVTEILTFLEQEVREWCGDSGLQDDVSALLLQRR